MSSGAAEAQLAQLDADRQAQAEIDRQRRAAYHEHQARRAAAACDARDSVRRARLDVEAAQDAFARAAVAERLDGTATEEQLSAAWTTIDRAQMRLKAAEAVAEELGGPDLV